MRISRFVFLLMVPLAVHAATPWSWLNGELTTLETRQRELLAIIAKLPPDPPPQALEHVGFHSGLAPTADSVRWVQVDLGAQYALDSVVVIPAMLSSAEAYGFPLRFRLDASNDPLFADSFTLLNHTAADIDSPLAPWHIAVKNVKARYVRFTATKLVAQPHSTQRFIFCLGEILVFSGKQNVALRSAVLAPNSVETLPTWSPKHLVDGSYALGIPVHPDDVNSNGWHSGISKTADITKWVEVDFGAVRELDEVRLVPAHPRDYPDRFGFGFPRRFKIEADSQIVFDSTGIDFANPGDTPVAFRTFGLRAKTLRITATRLWERSGDFVYALAELQALSEGKNIALGAAVNSSDDTFTPSWKREFLVDGRSSSGILIDEEAWLAALSKRREIQGELEQIAASRALALNTAQARAEVLVLGIISLLLIISGLAILRSRRLRQLEMESLRQRISRDLHDEIGSHLGSIRLMSELSLREGNRSESLKDIHRLAGEAAESMRGIVWLVREGDAPKLSSLVEAIRQSSTALLKGIECEFRVHSGSESATASLEFHRNVFLFFREAAYNVARHAGARRVQIDIDWNGGRLRIAIQDDGCGFDANAVTVGNGLSNLRHRAELLKGNVQILSEAGKGTRIILEAPWS